MSPENVARRSVFHHLHPHPDAGGMSVEQALVRRVFLGGAGTGADTLLHLIARRVDNLLE